jgi:hypothetical protein
MNSKTSMRASAWVWKRRRSSSSHSSGDATPAARVDLPLLKATARAYRWSDDLVSGRVRSIGEIAKREHLTGRHVRRVMQLAFLAPRIVKAIAEGRQPADLTTLAMTQRIELPPALAERGDSNPRDLFTHPAAEFWRSLAPYSALKSSNRDGERIFWKYVKKVGSKWALRPIRGLCKSP